MHINQPWFFRQRRPLYSERRREQWSIVRTRSKLTKSRATIGWDRWMWKRSGTYRNAKSKWLFWRIYLWMNTTLILQDCGRDLRSPAMIGDAFVQREDCLPCLREVEEISDSSKSRLPYQQFQRTHERTGLYSLKLEHRGEATRPTISKNSTTHEPSDNHLRFPENILCCLWLQSTLAYL